MSRTCRHISEAAQVRTRDGNYEMRCASWVRDFTSSFRNALRRWHSTMLWVMKS
jgi:hypothetical protein